MQISIGKIDRFSDYITVTITCFSTDIMKCIADYKLGKAPGADGITAEHLKY